jgi:hypothetical protein
MPRLVPILVAAGLGLPALAEAQQPPGPVGFLTAPPPGTMRVSDVIGTAVIGSDIRRLGTIDDVVLDPNGAVAAVVIGTGGFLGVGEKSVAVPFDLFLWNTGDVSRSAGPSASVSVGSAPANPRVGTAAGAERMPGAGISNEVLNAGPERRGGGVDLSTGSAAASGPPATISVADGHNGPERAIVRLTKADLEKAPAFRYDR